MIMSSNFENSVNPYVIKLDVRNEVDFGENSDDNSLGLVLVEEVQSGSLVDPLFIDNNTVLNISSDECEEGSSDSIENLKEETSAENFKMRFICKHCDYNTADYSQLKPHFQNHSMTSQIFCNKCNKLSLPDHIRDDHFFIIYSCNTCGYKTIIQSEIVLHIQDHSLMKEGCEKMLKTSIINAKDVVVQKPIEEAIPRGRNVPSHSIHLARKTSLNSSKNEKEINLRNNAQKKPLKKLFCHSSRLPEGIGKKQISTKNVIIQKPVIETIPKITNVSSCNTHFKRKNLSYLNENGKKINSQNNTKKKLPELTYSVNKLPETMIIEQIKLGKNSPPIFRCRQCPFKSIVYSRVSQHVVTDHNFLSKKISDEGVEEVICCSTCERHFENRSLFAHHVKTHTDSLTKPISIFKCAHCKLKSVSQMVVSNHIEKVHHNVYCKKDPNVNTTPVRRLHKGSLHNQESSTTHRKLDKQNIDGNLEYIISVD